VTPLAGSGTMPRMGHLDSHCHLDAAEFDGDRPAVASRAREHGVSTVVVPGVTVAGFERPPIDANPLLVQWAAGLHPAFEHPPDGLERLERALGTGRFVAIGETGVDKRFPDAHGETLCASQLDLAIAFRLPVILHVIRGHEEVLALVRARPGLRGVVHAFTGSWDLARRYLEQGFKLGFGGIATWPSARKLREAVVRCPSDGFVLETDAPDLSPEWHRGQRNEPGQLEAIAGAIAELRGESAEAVLAASDANSYRLFGIEETA